MQARNRRAILFLWCALVPAIALLVNVPVRPQQPLPSRFQFARDTTVILGPRDRYGYPDYLAALNLRTQMGVSHQNNAARAIFLTLAPNYLRAFNRQTEAELGISWFEPRHVFENRPEPVKGSNVEAALNRPWKAHEFHSLKLWLEINQEALLAVHQASRLTAWYAPKFANGQPAMLYAELLITQQLQAICEALRVRAMLRIGEGELESAWDDVLAIHKLALLQAQDHHFMTHAIAHEAEHGAFVCEQALLRSSELTPELIDRIRRELAVLPDMPGIASALNYGERYALLDSICLFAKLGTHAFKRRSFSNLGQLENSFTQGSLDFWFIHFVNWNRVLRTANKWVDDAIARVEIKSDAERARALNEFGEKIRATKLKPFENNNWIPRSTNWMVYWPLLRKQVTQWVADQIVTVIFPHVTGVASTHSRCRAERDLANVGWALAAYHASHNSYPDKLEVLVPRFLPRVPLDRMCDQPLKYQSNGQRFKLYSVGVNQLDDEGRTEADEPAGDDMMLLSRELNHAK